MTTLKPGDVVTDEPGPGAVIEVAGRRFLSCDQREGYEAARWCGQDGDDYEWCCWDDLRSLGPVRLLLPGVTDKCSSPVDTSTPAPAGDAAAELRASAPAPAEQWEPTTTDQVLVGEVVEVHLAHGDGSAIVTGPVTIGGPFVTIAERFVFALSDVRSIRRRVRQQMREPEAPAVVRHAGRVLVRGKSGRWLILDGPAAPNAGYTADGASISWTQVLALDPTVDPVVVDLGGGA